MSYNVKFISISCITQQDWSGSDDLVLTLKNQVLRQVGMSSLPTSQFNLGSYSSGTVRNINLEMILCNDNNTLSFYEDDLFGRDLLGQIDLRVEPLGYKIRKSLTGSGANYIVEMDILSGGEDVCDIAQ